MRIGMIHSQFGDIDGVSIVMRQIEQVLKGSMDIKDVSYLAGKSENINTTIVDVISLDYPLGKEMVNRYESGFSDIIDEIEENVKIGAEAITRFVDENHLDAIIAHNSCHPVNFIMSLSIAKYYKDCENPPKYIVWWHDSHLERDHFANPAPDVKKILLEGVPGPYPDFIIFINSTQFENAKSYFLELDKLSPGYYSHIEKNHAVVHNTSDTEISSSDDLKKKDKVDRFMQDFDVSKLLEENTLILEDVIFCLQHTRILERKRIDFAMRFCFRLLDRSDKKALYFLVSGHRADSTKEELIKLHEELSENHEKKVFLIFAEDVRTGISFREYPLIFAQLGGFTTHFSAVEGFGNNLLEVMGSGLIPAIYRYPVYTSDIEQYGFNIIVFDSFETTDSRIDEILDILSDEPKRMRLVDENLISLRKHLSHETMAPKLKKALESLKYHMKNQNKK